MVLCCMSCAYMFGGSIKNDELGWHGVCPNCGCSFPVEAPRGRIIMAFADDGCEEYQRSFPENFNDAWLKSYYAFDTPEDFIQAWKAMVQEPVGMWYYVLDNGVQIVSGACDEVDAEIIEDHFGIPVWDDCDGHKHHFICFSFDEEQTKINVDIIVTEPEEDFDEKLATLEDSISAYLEGVDEWQPEQLIRENLDALGMKYTILPAPERTFEI